MKYLAKAIGHFQAAAEDARTAQGRLLSMHEVAALLMSASARVMIGASWVLIQLHDHRYRNDIEYSIGCEREP